MTTPLFGRYAAETHATPILKMQLILMTTAPASSAASPAKTLHERICKLYANCLNPKEIWTITPSCGLFVVS
jgi:hypothetical protein